MASYIFGGDTEQTAESIARRREIAKALLEGSMYAAPQNVGEGLTAIGAAIGGRLANRRADKAEAAGRSEAMSSFQQNLPFWLQSSMGGASAPSAPSASQPTRSSAPSMAPQQAPQGKEEFISMMMPAALKASERTGVDPRLIIAQAAQETGWGKSAPGNNYFGIKSHGQGGGQNLATHEYVDGKRVNVNANFRQYGSPTESALGYADFLLNNPRYQPMLNAEGLDAQLAALGQSGYATDPNYAQSVGSIARSIPLPPEMPGNQGQDAISAVTGGGGMQSAYAPAGTKPAYQPGMVNDPAALGPARYAPGMAPQPSPQAAPAPQPPPQPAFNPLMQRRDQLAQQTGSQQIAQADPTKGFLAMILGGGQGGQPSGGEFPPAPSPDGMDAMRGPQLPFDPAMLELANNPFLPEGQRAVLQSMIEQQMQAADPMRRLEMQRAQLELEQLRNPQGEAFTLGEGQRRYDANGNLIAEGASDGSADLINAGDGRIYDPETREWIVAPNTQREAPKVQTLTLDDGSEMAVQWNGETGQWDPIDAPVGGANITPRNKLTESQAKITLFQNLQEETQPVLLDLESQFNPANIADAAARSTPIAGNFFQSEKGQIYQAAATAWAEGALRIATGAAATPEEMERTKRAYFAQPGDTPLTIAFKAQMREMYTRSINKALGSTADMESLPKPSDFMRQFSETPAEAETGSVTIDGYTIEEVD